MIIKNFLFDLDGTLTDPAEGIVRSMYALDILKSVLERHSLRSSETIMVGDRMHDVKAAKANGITSVAVSYGYGSPVK